MTNHEHLAQDMLSESTAIPPDPEHSRRCDTLAFQPHTLAAVLRRSEGEDQVSIIVFLYSKRIFFKCCNQIPA